MERLTGRDNRGVYYRHGMESGLYPYVDRPPHECVEAIERLAEYEDTGLTPEEIKGLITNYNEDEHEYCGEYGTENCQFQYRLEQLQKDRDYWKAEALKQCAKLGEIKLLMGRNG